MKITYFKILLVVCCILAIAYSTHTQAQVTGTPYFFHGMYYSVHFNANGGTGTDPVSRHGSLAYTVPVGAYTLAGYTFTGWNTKADGTGTSYAPNTRMTPTQNTTLYAQWGLNGVVGATPASCTAGNIANDNGLTACGTTRTWQCVSPNGGTTADGSYYNGDCPVVGSTPGTCTKGTVTNDNGATACNTTRTWQCVLNGGTADGSYYNGDCPVVGSTPGTCDKGTVTNDNGLTACNTTRIWQCVQNGGTANGTYYNGDCPVAGSTPGTCTVGTLTADNGATACGTTRTWVCTIGGANTTGTRYNGDCPRPGVCNGDSGCLFGTWHYYECSNCCECWNCTMRISKYCVGTDGVWVDCGSVPGQCAD